MSALHEALADYVATVRALGTQLRFPATALRHFVDFLEHEGAEFVTTVLALRWATESDRVEPATWARRLSIVRRFATWLHATDPRTEVPPQGLLPTGQRRKAPHIYSDREITQLMFEAARLPSPTGLRALTFTTLLGLLVSTGLRPGEALALDRVDVDLDNGILAVRDTKFTKSRFVPVEISTRVALADYAKRRDELCPCRRTRAFLVAERGSRLGPHAARRTFAKLSRAIGLRPPKKETPKKEVRIGREPRLQDMRHTFATRTLIEWYRTGLNSRS